MLDDGRGQTWSDPQGLTPSGPIDLGTPSSRRYARSLSGRAGIASHGVLRRLGAPVSISAGMCAVRLALLVLAVLACALQAVAQDRSKIEVVPHVAHSNDITSVALSTDGAHVLSGSSDQTVKLWDVATGQLLRTCRGIPTGYRRLRSRPMALACCRAVRPDSEVVGRGPGRRPAHLQVAFRRGIVRCVLGRWRSRAVGQFGQNG
jgi:WD40 repeat protein